MTGPTSPDGLTVLAQAHWPENADADAPEPLAGFIGSFSPLVADVAQRCLVRHYGSATADPARCARTAVILASVYGDLGTADAVHAAVGAGRKVNPLLFFQSVPNAVLGHIAARWGLAGPVITLSAVDEPLGEALAEATAVIADGDADEALLVTVDQGSVRGGRDTAAALLVARVAAPTEAPG